MQEIASFSSRDVTARERVSSVLSYVLSIVHNVDNVLCDLNWNALWEWRVKKPAAMLKTRLVPKLALV